jgi:four helix bundle protein
MDPRVIEVLAAWEPSVSPFETTDKLWQLHAYRVARCLVDQVNDDAVTLQARVDERTLSQFLRAVGSIGANIAEGYSRRGLTDRARFYGYALGSQREALLWLRSLAHAMPAEAVALRMLMLAQVRRLLLGLVRSVQARGDIRFQARGMPRPPGGGIAEPGSPKREE